MPVSATIIINVPTTLERESGERFSFHCHHPNRKRTSGMAKAVSPNIW